MRRGKHRTKGLPAAVRRYGLKRVLLPALFGVVALAGFLVLSLPGVWNEGRVPRIFPDRILYVLYLFVGENPDELASPKHPLHQFVALIALVLTLGAALQVFASVFSRLSRWLIVHLRYHGHTIICGLNRKGVYLARAFAAAGLPVIIIEKDSNNRFIDAVRNHGLRVHIGDATKSRALEQAGYRKAKRVFCLCDDDTNFEIVHAMERVSRRVGSRPPCSFVHVAERHLFDELQYHESSSRRAALLKQRSRKKAGHVDFINVATWGAMCLLDWQPRSCRAGALFSSTTENHIVVIGAGALGQSFIVECARRWSILPAAERGSVPHFTIVDRLADSHLEELQVDHPSLAANWRLRGYEMEIPSVGFDRGDFLPEEMPEPSRVLVAMSDERKSLMAALRVLRLIVKRGWRNTLIIVRVTEGHGIMWSEALTKNNTEWCRQLQPFHLYKEVLTVDFVRYAPPEQIAIALHDAYLKNEKSANPGASLQDKPAMVPWDLLDEQYRESNRAQAASIVIALASLGDPRVIEMDEGRSDPLTDKELEFLAQREHDRWMAEKITSGWSYGSTRDNQRKLHPNLVEWDALDEPSKDIDRAMVNSWPKVLGEAGLAIRKKN